QLGLKAPRAEGPAAEFSKLIRKEPKYETQEPFRGVARLGTQQFGFALDCVPPKPGPAKSPPDAGTPPETKAAKKSDSAAKEKPKPGPAPAYNRLYFDLNHNGDLTDDKPIEAIQTPDRVFYPRNYAYSQFPRIDLTLDVAGVKVQYGFFMTAMRYSGGDFQYVDVSITPGVYREGRITLEGKERRLVLIDFNSNGRFDDQATTRSLGNDTRLYPSYGDVLVVDPSPPGVVANPWDVTTSPDRHLVSKLVCLDGRFYELKITPAGDRVTLEPSKAPVGTVTSRHEQFRALLYGDLGVVKVSAGKQPVPIPAGQWHLLSYTIDMSAQRQRQREEAAKKEPGKRTDQKPSAPAEGAWLQALARALVGAPPGASPARQIGPTLVSAAGIQSAAPIVVRKDGNTVLPFGPPYRPVVKIDYADPRRMDLTRVVTETERLLGRLIGEDLALV
ncbi:MAG: hypothetical protein NUV77_18770, partial [Thermoguttaceae bacterium]|nr:hypothetical protein [Thermoguttaceae bacterium]